MFYRFVFASDCLFMSILGWISHHLAVQLCITWLPSLVREIRHVQILTKYTTRYIFLLFSVGSGVLLQPSVPSCARQRCPSYCRMTFHLSIAPRKLRSTRKRSSKSVSILLYAHYGLVKQTVNTTLTYYHLLKGY